MSAATGGTSVTEDDLIAKARALGPLLAENRLRTREHRRIPDDIAAALKKNQFQKACQPARFGGFELPFGTSMNVAAELAKVCGSTGWVASVMGVHAWMMAKFDSQAQDDVWGETPDAVVASAFRFGEGEIAPVEGGYKVTGTVYYASGIDLVDWALIGTPPLAQPEGPPQRAFLVVPKSDYKILDVWHSPGLSGTGTNNMELNDVFVPAHRAIAFGDINKVETPGSRDYSSAYRLPMFGPFNYSVSAPALGMAEGALEEFCRHMGTRDDIVRQKRIAENATLQLRTSEASAEIDSARQLFDNDVALMRKAAADGAGLTSETVARLKRNSAYVATLCKRAVARLVETMGAGGLYHDNLVQLAHADVQAASVHITTVWDLNALAYGKVLLGVEEAPPG